MTNENQEFDIETDPLVEKQSRGIRLERSDAARNRRKQTKQAKAIRQTKLEREAKQRLKSSRS